MFDGRAMLAFCCGVTLMSAACAKPRLTTQSAAVVATATLSDADMGVATCGPVAERAGRELGCFTLFVSPIGQLPAAPMFWYIDGYTDGATADAARGPRGTVVESFGRVWLLSIESAGWRTSSGERIAEVGPLPVAVGPSYAAQYMEAVFSAGNEDDGARTQRPRGVVHAHWTRLARRWQHRPVPRPPIELDLPFPLAREDQACFIVRALPQQIAVARRLPHQQRSDLCGRIDRDL